MHKTAQSIISVLRKAESEISTSNLLREIDERYADLKKQLEEREDLKVKRELAKLHRKALHHLNNLVSSGILRVVRHGERGEKYFSLNMGEGEEIVEVSPKYGRRTIVSRQVMPSMPIEGYEQKEMVHKYEPATWIDRLNSVVVFVNKIENQGELYKIVTENIFPIVNDAILLEQFESLINGGDVTDFLEKIDGKCEEFGKLINITINLSELKNRDNFLSILRMMSGKKFEKINFIFALDNSDIEEESEFIENIIETFSKNKIMLYIKNKKIKKAPYFIGRAGPYCFSDKEWLLAEDLRDNIVCLGCSQSSAVIDVNKFFKEYGLDIKKFSELMFSISKSVLSANSIQRRKSEDCFRSVNHLNEGKEADFLTLSRNYVRIWNFGLFQEGINPEFVFNMINEAKKKIDEFASAEETIYKSCGMTTRFKIALASTYSTSVNLSEAKYSKLELSNPEDINKKEIREKLKAREIAGKVFEGGDEVTFHYFGELKTKEIMSLIDVVLSNYKIPLFNYSFEGVKGDLKLTNFLK